MQSFMLNEQGDVVIEGGEIRMIHGAELTAQTLKCVLSTQKGEWFLDWEEGINHDAIFGKKRYASQNSGIASQYIKEIDEIKQENRANENALNELLAKRLDGDG